MLKATVPARGRHALAEDRRDDGDRRVCGAERRRLRTGRSRRRESRLGVAEGGASSGRVLPPNPAAASRRAESSSLEISRPGATRGVVVDLRDVEPAHERHERRGRLQIDALAS